MDIERNRALRRSQARKHGSDHTARPSIYKPEKNWKLLYLRSEKLLRARQLGFDYPIRTTRQLLEAQ